MEFINYPEFKTIPQSYCRSGGCVTYDQLNASVASVNTAVTGK
ncbi:unnamed protein product [Oncorhynchus mykiss]|uniref:Uncharacterized protein n=1 Tax=Oncorhynchus mykiss TaxID=8022 RepID=A0A060W1Q9_ONCMY|nr:unnamed protein product [Oncorhynchus mykiss]